MKLKQYQADTLDVLRRFLEEARVAGPGNAYASVTAAPEQAKRLGRHRGRYVALDGLPGVPYVCLRLPTGGGKTVLAAHAIGVARDAWVEKDFPIALWLVPSNTIRRQTVEALRNPRHAYRRVLDETFEGRVRVFDITDFTTIRPHDIRDHACVVVATIQTLRVGNTDGRRVYAHNEDMEPHFSAVPKTTAGLEQVGGGTETSGDPRFSFANLLHLHRPLMIVDEAHGAVTGLTRDMQARVNPCAIIEFTATPRDRSNILHSVTAQELKAAQMIKLPIMLAEHESWQSAVNAAIASRASLAEEARHEADYVRPIVLFQAQPRNQEVTAEALKRHLIDTENVPADRIVIATGDQRGLDGIELFDPKCRVEHVITVEALKEGWDCSFAYVFCSLSRIQSATDVEQLLGRVLRMPYAQRRRADGLNRAYAHVSETSFGFAAKALADKLVDMGFEEEESKDAIELMQGDLADTRRFAPRARARPVFRYLFSATPEDVAVLTAIEGVSVVAKDGGKFEMAVTGRVAPEREGAIALAISAPERLGFAEAVATFRFQTEDQLTPAERGESFRVPRLVTEIQGSLEFADVDVFMEFHDWSLAAHPARLDEAAFAVRATASSFEIDLDGGRVAYQFAGEGEQLALDVEVEGWSQQSLALWLDRQLRQPDIHQSDLLRWLSDAVGHLCGPRKILVPTLMRTKFILARKLRERLVAARLAEQRAVYQRTLFAPGARVEVSFDNGFEFRDGMYQDVKKQTGRWKPSKHFLGPAGLPEFSGAVDGEEFQCAQVIDSLPQVKFWLRNVSRHPESFWLPTASDKFYPDFVARLNDGRVMVIEYKGAHLAGADDTHEKHAIGSLWERCSSGKGLFALVEKWVGDRDMRRQLQDRIAG